MVHSPHAGCFDERQADHNPTSLQASDTDVGMQMLSTIPAVWQDPPEHSGSGLHKTFSTAGLKPHPMLPVLQLMALHAFVQNLRALLCCFSCLLIPV